MPKPTFEGAYSRKYKALEEERLRREKARPAQEALGDAAHRTRQLRLESKRRQRSFAKREAARKAREEAERQQTLGERRRRLQQERQRFKAMIPTPRKERVAGGRPARAASAPLPRPPPNVTGRRTNRVRRAVKAHQVEVTHARRRGPGGDCNGGGSLPEDGMDPDHILQDALRLIRGSEPQVGREEEEEGAGVGPGSRANGGGDLSCDSLDGDSADAAMQDADTTADANDSRHWGGSRIVSAPAGGVRRGRGPMGRAAPTQLPWAARVDPEEGEHGAWRSPVSDGSAGSIDSLDPAEQRRVASAGEEEEEEAEADVELSDDSLTAERGEEGGDWQQHGYGNHNRHSTARYRAEPERLPAESRPTAEAPYHSGTLAHGLGHGEQPPPPERWSPPRQSWAPPPSPARRQAPPPSRSSSNSGHRPAQPRGFSLRPVQTPQGFHHPRPPPPSSRLASATSSRRAPHPRSMRAASAQGREAGAARAGPPPAQRVAMPRSFSAPHRPRSRAPNHSGSSSPAYDPRKGATPTEDEIDVLWDAVRTDLASQRANARPSSAVTTDSRLKTPVAKDRRRTTESLARQRTNAMLQRAQEVQSRARVRAGQLQAKQRMHLAALEDELEAQQRDAVNLSMEEASLLASLAQLDRLVAERTTRIAAASARGPQAGGDPEQQGDGASKPALSRKEQEEALRRSVSSTERALEAMVAANRRRKKKKKPPAKTYYLGAPQSYAHAWNASKRP